MIGLTWGIAQRSLNTKKLKKWTTKVVVNWENCRRNVTVIGYRENHQCVLLRRYRKFWIWLILIQDVNTFRYCSRDVVRRSLMSDEFHFCLDSKNDVKKVLPKVVDIAIEEDVLDNLPVLKVCFSPNLEKFLMTALCPVSKLFLTFWGLKKSEEKIGVISGIDGIQIVSIKQKIGLPILQWVIRMSRDW